MDHIIRKAAFDWLSAQSIANDGIFTRRQLEAGFEFQNENVRLVGPQGIFKPRQLALPLTITTVTNGPYNDTIGNDQLLHYRYRGNNPSHPENVGLRELMRRKLPLIYFHGLFPGRYLAQWPVFIVGDSPSTLTFSVAVEDRIFSSDVMDAGIGVSDEAAVLARRQYITVLMKRRLHQVAFRERILSAYRNQCALCSLRHRELLDAAHIILDPAYSSQSSHSQMSSQHPQTLMSEDSLLIVPFNPFPT